MTDTLHLDKRQRAMLAEMGVRVWSPMSEVAVMGAPAVETLAVDTSASSAEALPVEAVLQAHADEAHSFAPASELATQAIAAAAAPILIQRPEGIDHMDWSALQTTVSACQACALCGSRQNTVFGVGAPAKDGQAPQVDWLFVGEVPNEQEDDASEPFVGSPGLLFDNMLHAMNLSRTGERTAEGGGVFITTATKCRTPGNRNPKPDEMAQCAAYLERQVALLQPKMIVAMGRFAVQALLRESVPELDSTPYAKLRGRVYRYQNVPVVVTYHPRYVMRDLTEKAKVWADLCLAMAHVKGAE
jgi:uracil-DNA glycosylase